MRGILRRLLILGLIGGIFLGAIYGVVSYRYWNNLPKLSRNYAAKLNAPVLAVAKEKRAWPIYRAAMFDIAKDEPEHWRQNLDKFQRVLHDKDVVEYVLKQEQTLRRVREAAKLPSLGYTLADSPPPEDWLLRTRRTQYTSGVVPTPPAFTPSENPQLLSVLLTAAADSSELSLLLSAHGLIVAQRGDTDAAVADISAMIGMAKQIREIPLLVNDLVSFKRYGEALKTWGHLLTTMPGKFTKLQLLALESEAKSYCDGRIAFRMSGERASFDDLLQRLFTDDGNGDGYGFAPAIAGGIEREPDDSLSMKITAPLLRPRHWSRRRNREEADRLFTMIERELERPYWDCDCDAYSREMHQVRRDDELRLLYILMPAFSNLHAMQQSAVQGRDAILTASALVRYRVDRGDWPDELSALVPRYLSTLPLDQFTGKPLCYQVVDDEPMIYSVGFDKQDDGGRLGFVGSSGSGSGSGEPWYFSFSNSQKQTVGDLILWPVQSPVIPLEPEPPIMRIDQ